MNQDAPPFEIGDGVVFGHSVYSSRHPAKWTEGRVINIAGPVIKVAWINRFGIRRTSWVPLPTKSQASDWRVERQERAEEIITRTLA